MKRHRIGILFFLLLLFLAGNTTVSADQPGRGDFEFWNTETVSWKLAPRWLAFVEEELRFNDHADDFYYHHTDIGAGYYLLPQRLFLSAHQRFYWQKKKGEWLDNYLPHVDLKVQGAYEPLAFYARLRMSYVDRNDAKDGWRNRLKVQAELQEPLWGIFKPYLNDEIFFDYVAGKMNQNRASVGTGVKLWGPLRSEVYYLWQCSEVRDHWKNTHVLGTKLSLAF